MGDEAEIRLGGETHAGDGDEERGSQQSPLQGRAAFIQNWSWESVRSFNRGACERGKAQHGDNPETHRQVQAHWEKVQTEILTLGEALDFLRQCHKDAPFLFFNGNTFAEIARRILDVVFFEFPIVRRREAASLAAHYVAGVLDKSAMEDGLTTLAQLASFAPGDMVKSLRGHLSGKVIRILPDGRLLCRTASGAEISALPESLIKVTP